MLRADPSAHDASKLDPYEAAWLSGYFAGVARAQLDDAPSAQNAAGSAKERVLVLYGSETGNSARVAARVAERLRAAGAASELIDLGNYKPRALEREKAVIIVTSTHGDGTPPEPARHFFEQLHAASAPKSLAQLRYAVLGLGDSSYEHFCRAARILDERLAELGAQRLVTRVDCDLDFDEPATAFISNVLPHVTAPSGVSLQLVQRPAEATPARVVHDEKRPFSATVLENFALTGRGSSKQTRHLALSIDPGALSFEPGDALGICAPNDPALAHKLARCAGFSGDEKIAIAGEQITLASALIERLDINLATPRFLQSWAQASSSAVLKELSALPEPEQRKFLRGHHVLDLVRSYPASEIAPDKFVQGLRRLAPRMYSIASSPAAVGDEVHLTVTTVRYNLHGRSCSGVASGHIADRLEEGDTLPVFVQANPRFRLPADPDARLIMIGAGTGVAPYRAFMQERAARGARGETWLFFGERNFRTDFLYQTEWQGWVHDRTLSRITLAFSRDQAQKIYVQQRLLEHATDLYAWLEDGAHLYICGDASAFAPGVEAALSQIAERHRGSRERAQEYLHALSETGRYHRDVY